MSGTRHNCLGPGITGRGPDIISRGPDIFISGPRPYSQWRSLGPDIKGRRPDIISQGPNLVSWGPNIINSGPRHKCFLFILKYYFSHSTQYNHLYDVPSQPPYNLVSTKWSFYHSSVYISLTCTLRRSIVLQFFWHIDTRPISPFLFFFNSTFYSYIIIVIFYLMYLMH